MPIVALEGPDRCGKTTLWRELREVLSPCVSVRTDFAVELLPVVGLVEQREEALWRQLYDSRKLYLLDRHFVVTPIVYGRLYNRPQLLDPQYWRTRSLIVTLNTPVDVLQERHKLSSEWFDASLYQQCSKLYADELQHWNTLPVGWHYSPPAAARFVAAWVRKELNV